MVSMLVSDLSFLLIKTNENSMLMLLFDSSSLSPALTVPCSCLAPYSSRQLQAYEHTDRWAEVSVSTRLTCRLWASCQLRFLHFTFQLIKLSGRLYSRSPLTPFNSHHFLCWTHMNTMLALSVEERKPQRNPHLTTYSNCNLWSNQRGLVSKVLRHKEFRK